jgi:tetratricopeptide (TPR) repeat protein
MHDLLRAYAAARSEADDTEQDRALAVRRMLDHYLHSSYAAALTIYPNRTVLSLPPAQPGVTRHGFAEPTQAHAWFMAEHQVLLAAVEAAATRHRLGRYAWQLASALSTFLSRSGHWHDWVATQQVAVRAATQLGDGAGEAHAQRALGLAYNRLGQSANAQIHLQRSFELHQHFDDPCEQAYTHLCMSTTFESQGDNRNGLAHARAALELYRVAGSLVGQAQSSNSISWFHAELGNYLEAIEHCERAVALYRELGDRQGMAQSLDSLGFARHRMGDYQQAADTYREAILELRAAGDGYHEAIPLTHLGQTHQAAGQIELARNAWQEALGILERLDHPDAEKVRAWLEQLDLSP